MNKKYEDRGQKTETEWEHAYEWVCKSWILEKVTGSNQSLK